MDPWKLLENHQKSRKISAHMRCGSDLSPHWWENATFTSTPTLFHKYVPARQGFVKVFITIRFPYLYNILLFCVAFQSRNTRHATISANIAIHIRRRWSNLIGLPSTAVLLVSIVSVKKNCNKFENFHKVFPSEVLKLTIM